MIKLDHVCLDWDGRTVLTDIDLDLTERRIGIIGANGTGKSSLVRLFNGLLMPSRGQVCVNGIDTTDDAKAARRRVGFVFQNPDNQIVMPTVAEDLAFGLKNADMPQHEITRLVESELDRFGLAGMENRMAHSLSAGEKQLLAIAGVTAMRPACIVFDEPTTLLDLGNKKRVMAAIDGLAEMAIVVTHDLDSLNAFDRVICLHQGRVHADGAPKGVIRAYQDLFTC